MLRFLKEWYWGHYFSHYTNPYPQGDLIHFHGFTHHLYADNFLIYIISPETFHKNKKIVNIWGQILIWFQIFPSVKGEIVPKVTMMEAKKLCSFNSLSFLQFVINSNSKRFWPLPLNGLIFKYEDYLTELFIHTHQKRIGQFELMEKSLKLEEKSLGG